MTAVALFLGEIAGAFCALVGIPAVLCLLAVACGVAP